MRIRDGPAAVRGDAPPPRSHWREPGRRRGREPRVRRPVALLISRTPRGREASGASFIRRTRRCSAGCTRRLGRRCVRWRFGHVGVIVVPGHRRRVQRQGHGQETACRIVSLSPTATEVCSPSAPPKWSRSTTVRLSEDALNGALGFTRTSRRRHLSPDLVVIAFDPKGSRARSSDLASPSSTGRREHQGRVPADPAARARHGRDAPRRSSPA